MKSVGPAVADGKDSCDRWVRSTEQKRGVTDGGSGHDAEAEVGWTKPGKHKKDKFARECKVNRTQTNTRRQKYHLLAGNEIGQVGSLYGWHCIWSHIVTMGGEIIMEWCTAKCGRRYTKWHPDNMLVSQCPCASLLCMVWAGRRQRMLSSACCCRQLSRTSTSCWRTYIDRQIHWDRTAENKTGCQCSARENACAVYADNCSKKQPQTETKQSLQHTYLWPKDFFHHSAASFFVIR